MRLSGRSQVIAASSIIIFSSSGAALAQDIAFGKTVYATSVTSDATPAIAAVDGDATTMWQSSGSARPYTYLEGDLGGFYAINRVELALGTSTGSAPASFEVQARNGCWKTIPQTLVTSNPSSGIAKAFDIGCGSSVTRKGTAAACGRSPRSAPCRPRAKASRRSASSLSRRRSLRNRSPPGEGDRTISGPGAPLARRPIG